MGGGLVTHAYPLPLQEDVTVRMQLSIHFGDNSNEVVRLLTSDPHTQEQEAGDGSK